MLIQANADTPQQVQAAQIAGADGIGLCRTEPMLLASERLPLMRALTVAPDGSARQRALRSLLPLHQADLEAIFRVASPLSIIIRLLDPPLMDFLPTLQQIEIDLSSAREEENWDQMIDLANLRDQHTIKVPVNPTMGHRGCRLSLTHPEILRAQVVAILRAALAVTDEGRPVVPGILIPLIASAEEMCVLRRMVSETAAEVFAQVGKAVDYRVGALIELPRAAICAGSISKNVDFISFGTNDLTQTTYGLSRTDTGVYLQSCLSQGIFVNDPFVSLDKDGVGHLISVAVAAIRRQSPSIQIGACGDHVTDPESLCFLQSVGLNFVSCPPEYVAHAKRISSEIVGSTGPRQAAVRMHSDAAE